MEIHIELQVQAAKNILPMPWSWRYKFTVYNCTNKETSGKEVTDDKGIRHENNRSFVVTMMVSVVFDYFPLSIKTSNIKSSIILAYTRKRTFEP